MLEQHTRRRPDAEALVCGDKRLTYAQLNAWANQIANALVASGIRRGDHVALLCPNLPYFPAVYFGILKTGATVVPLNVLLKPREIAYHLRDSDAKAMFCFQGTPELPMAEAAKAAIAVVPACKKLIVLPHPVDSARSRLRRRSGRHPARRSSSAASRRHSRPCETRPDDTAVILYTSGTTGQPKGAELTHLNMVVNGMVSAELCAASHDESGRHATAVTLPLFHATAQTAQMLAYLHLGGTLVLLPRFDPAALLAAMTAERITHWIGVPTMYWTLLKHAREQNIDVSRVSGDAAACRLGRRADARRADDATSRRRSASASSKAMVCRRRRRSRASITSTDRRNPARSASRCLPSTS